MYKIDWNLLKTGWVTAMERNPFQEGNKCQVSLEAPLSFWGCHDLLIRPMAPRSPDSKPLAQGGQMEGRGLGHAICGQWVKGRWHVHIICWQQENY